MRRKTINFLLILHLSIIFLGTSLFDFAKVPPLFQTPVIYYLAMTGGHPYNFFSPDIPTQTLVNCYITEKDNKVDTLTFDKNTNTFELRLNYLFQLLDNNEDMETATQIASDYCFRTFINAESVHVSIDKFIVPSIQAYKQGKKATLSELYTQTFTHE
jgi:hypothetical protein